MDAIKLNWLFVIYSGIVNDPTGFCSFNTHCFKIKAIIIIIIIINSNFSNFKGGRKLIKHNGNARYGRKTTVK